MLACLTLGEGAGLIAYGLVWLWNPSSWLQGVAPVAVLAGPLGALAAVALGARLGQQWPVVASASKFSVVGGSNTLIDLGVLNLLMHTAGIVSGPLFAVFKAGSFLAAVTNSYFWNKHWSFHDAKPREPTNDLLERRQFALFVLTTGIGMAVNTGVATALVQLGPLGTGLTFVQWASVAAVVALLVSAGWNFCICRYLVFKHSGEFAGRAVTQYKCELAQADNV